MTKEPGHTEYESRWAIDPDAAALMGTDELRQNVLIEDLFVPGQIKLTYSHDDRMIVGGAVLYGTNRVSIVQVSDSPPLRMVQVDCVWSYPERGPFTNSVVMYRSPDQ